MQMNSMSVADRDGDTKESEAVNGASRSTSFIFDHLPKTGGTAFKTILEQIFGPENVSPAVSGRSELWSEDTYARYPVITGHFHSPIPVDRTNRRRARITMLRDPIDRAISEYFYYRNDVERVEWNKLAVLAKDHDFYAYIKLLESNRDMAISNYYSRRFASQISRKSGNQARLLELAKEALLRYDFVGIQEQFNDSIDLFCCKFKLPLVPQIERINVTSLRSRLQELDPKTRKKLLQLNEVDVELYEFALRQFEEQKRAIFRVFAAPGKPKSSPDDLKKWAQTRKTANENPESFGDRAVEFCGATVRGERSGSNVLRSGEEAILRLEFTAHVDVCALTVGIEISDELGEIVFGTNTHLMGESRPVTVGKTYEVNFAFAANLRHGRYSVGASLHTGATHEDRCFDWRDGITTFDVVDEAAPVFVGYCRLQPTIRWTANCSASESDRSLQSSIQ
jgi:hypothetical protein